MCIFLNQTQLSVCDILAEAGAKGWGQRAADPPSSVCSVKAKYAARIQEVPAFGPHVLSILAKHGEASKFEPRNIMKTLTKYHKNSRNIQKLQGPDRSAGYVWFGMNIGSLSWNRANYSWQPWQLFRKRHQGHQQTSHLMFAYSRDFGSVLRSLIGVLLSGVVLSSFSPKWPYLIAAGLSGWAGVRGVVRNSSWDVKIKVDASWNQQSWYVSIIFDGLSLMLFDVCWKLRLCQQPWFGPQEKHSPKETMPRGERRGRQYHVCMIPTSSPQATMSLCFVSAFLQLRCWSHCF